MSDDLAWALENMSSQDRTLRPRAFEIINQAREEAVPALLEILRQDDGYRQEIALGILWEFFREYGITHPELIPTLVTAIRMNINPLVIQDGLGFLADLKSPSAFDDLVAFIQDDEEMVREGALEALALLKDVRATPFLITALKDTMPDIRYRAVWALGYIGHETGIHTLIDILKNPDIASRDPYLVETIVRELRRVGTAEALDAVEKWERRTKSI